MSWAITGFSQMILAYGIGHGIRDHGVSEYPCGNIMIVTPAKTVRSIYGIGHGIRDHGVSEYPCVNIMTVTARQDSDIELFSRTVQSLTELLLVASGRAQPLAETIEKVVLLSIFV